MIPVIFSATLIIEGARAIEQASTATQTAAPVPQTWIAAVYMIAVLLIGQAGMWIREVVKFRDFRRKNGHLDAIKKSAESAAKKATEAAETSIETKAMVTMMQANCSTTTSRLARTIEANTSRIVDIASKKN